MKKILAFLLCLTMMAGLVPAALADGGTYTTFYSGEVSTLNYLVASTENDQIVGANIVDTLVEYNNMGEVIPCLAESWENSDDGLTWTFHLRKGVKWYEVYYDGGYAWVSSKYASFSKSGSSSGLKVLRALDGRIRTPGTDMSLSAEISFSVMSPQTL